uniref:N-acetyltransferase domain-containing protein n=1 Tax=Panagrellus redivivus TaxID=6233 RepID=A0A7E4ZTW9_PANRE
MPTLDDIVILEHAGQAEWLQIVQLVGELESWLLSDNDFNQWSNGLGPENFNLIVAVDKATQKQVVGSVATALYKSIDGSPPLVTVGMFFIRPEYRGLGLGLILFEKVLADPRFKGVNRGLNGVPAMTKKYASKHGFDKYADWKLGVAGMRNPPGEINSGDIPGDFPGDMRGISPGTNFWVFLVLNVTMFQKVRCEIPRGKSKNGDIPGDIPRGKSPGISPSHPWGVVEADTKDIATSALESESTAANVKIVNVADVPFDKIVAYDVKQLDGIRRDGYLKLALTDPSAWSKVALDSDGNIVGLVRIRPGFGNQLAVGPWYAESTNIAAAILKATIESIPNLTNYNNLFIFPADTNKEAYTLFDKLAQGKSIDHGTMFGQFTDNVVKTDPTEVFSMTEYAMSFV